MLTVDVMAAPFRKFLHLQRTLPKPFFHSHIKQCIRCSAATAAASTAPKRKWQLHSAVCLQRFPVITQELSPLEEKYQELMKKREVRESLLSDHEIQAIKEIEQKKKAEKQAVSDRPKHQDVATVTVGDLERDWQKELEEFQTASRTTEADKTNDLKSTEKKLDRKLILLVKQAFDTEKEPVWRFPQVERQEGESMRQAAERALASCCGDVSATFVGNAPSGYLDYKLPPGCADQYGVKLFYFKASYREGKISFGDKVTDYIWVTKEELPDYLSPFVNESVQEFLLEY